MPATWLDQPQDSRQEHGHKLRKIEDAAAWPTSHPRHALRAHRLQDFGLFQVEVVFPAPGTLMATVPDRCWSSLPHSSAVNAAHLARSLRAAPVSAQLIPPERPIPSGTLDGGPASPGTKTPVPYLSTAVPTGPRSQRASAPARQKRA